MKLILGIYCKLLRHDGMTVNFSDVKNKLKGCLYHKSFIFNQMNLAFKLRNAF
jgi:hypothetical protein